MMDNQQMLMYAGIAFLIWWFFFKNGTPSLLPETFEPQLHEYHVQEQPEQPHVHLTQEEAEMLQVGPPPPAEVPQYAGAFTA